MYVFMCRHVYVYEYDCFMYVHMCTYVTCSHKMIDKSHFGTIEIFIYSERRENADDRGEKMMVVSAKIKKLW